MSIYIYLSKPPKVKDFSLTIIFVLCNILEKKLMLNIKEETMKSMRFLTIAMVVLFVAAGCSSSSSSSSAVYDFEFETYNAAYGSLTTTETVPDVDNPYYTHHEGDFYTHLIRHEDAYVVVLEVSFPADAPPVVGTYNLATDEDVVVSMLVLNMADNLEVLKAYRATSGSFEVTFINGFGAKAGEEFQGTLTAAVLSELDPETLEIAAGAAKVSIETAAVDVIGGEVVYADPDFEFDPMETNATDGVVAWSPADDDTAIIADIYRIEGDYTVAFRVYYTTDNAPEVTAYDLSSNEAHAVMYVGFIWFDASGYVTDYAAFSGGIEFTAVGLVGCTDSVAYSVTDSIYMYPTYTWSDDEGDWMRPNFYSGIVIIHTVVDDTNQFNQIIIPDGGDPAACEK